MFNHQFVVSSPDGVVKNSWVVELISFFGSLREQRFVELLVGLSLHLVLVFDFGHVLLPPVGNLQEEHGIVVEDVEEDDDVDNEGE